MDFGSICSGIEGASVAWAPLGWKASWLSEVDKAASELLAYRFPHTPNHGDMLLLAGKVRRREIPAPSLLCGGTPCQAFSVAGLRRGLEDERGQLTLAFVDLANAIDEVRIANGLEPCIIVWENVPGVLSSKDNALGCFLAGLAGEDDALVPSGKRWPDAGCVLGPQRAIAWRVLDAQFFRLAQRRRRVFLVASARQGFDPAAILFEFDGVRRDTPPSREAGEGIAGTLDARSTGGGFPGTDGACSGHVVPAAPSGIHGSREGQERDDFEGLLAGGGRVRQPAGLNWPAEVACTLNAHFGEKQGLEDQHINGGQACSFPPPVSLCLNAGGMGRRDAETETLIPMHGGGFDEAPSHATQPLCFSSKDYGADCSVGVSPTLRAGGHADSHANAGVPPAVAYAIQERAVSANPAAGPDGVGVRSDNCAYTLEARTVPQAVCVTGSVTHTLKAEGFDASEDGTGRGQPIVNAFMAFQTSGYGASVDTDVASTMQASYSKLSNQVYGVIHQMAVRRLMPVECERLQGFPDGHTRIPIKHYAKRKITKSRPAELWQADPQGGWWLMAADGPRYKQLGNSWAVLCVRWIGRRIQAQLDATRIGSREFDELTGHNGGPPLDDGFDALLAA